MKKTITKLMLSLFALALMVVTVPVNAFAKEKGDSEISQELIEQLEEGVPDYTDEEFNAMVENTAKEVEYMAEHGIISFDKNGYLTYVNVDKLEEIYGADVNTAELRELMAPRPMTRGHIENFTNCMVGKLAKSLGINELRNLITGEIANYFSKGAYQKAIQKLAQRAVDKLGKKAAIKLVNFALPSGWVLNAAKVGLWSVQCTIFYD